MKVGINRPNFFPWLGFFALLDEVDTFIILDNISISVRNFVARNKIKGKNGDAIWIVESKKKCSLHTLVSNVYLSSDLGWKVKLLNKIQDAYRKAPHYTAYQELIGDLIFQDERKLSVYNTNILKTLTETLGIKVRFLFASELTEKVHEVAQERIMDLCIAAGGLEYFNARDGIEKGLYRPDDFSKRNLALVKQLFQHPVYPQANGAFVSHLSILDLLFNCGDESLEIIRSGNGWEKQNSL